MSCGVWGLQFIKPILWVLNYICACSFFFVLFLEVVVEEAAAVCRQHCSQSLPVDPWSILADTNITAVDSSDSLNGP